MDNAAQDRRKLPEWLSVSDWTAPDGWRLRAFSASPSQGVPVRGSLLFQTGRADFIEKYLESIAHWRVRGWNVAGFDWRGQGGSGRLLADPRVGHAPPYALLVDDLAAFLGAWQARTPPPHLLVGHSMGAHLLLRLLADRQPPVAGAALLSPMCGLDTRPLPEAVARLLVALACRLGLSDRPVWKDKGRSGHRQRNLTHSLVRYEDELWWRGQHPMLDVGPPSWGWLHESWRSIDWLRRPGMIERVGVPVLLLWSERDRLVRPSATRAVAARLARARVGVSQDAAHELLREEGVLQNWAVAELDAFLESFAA